MESSSEFQHASTSQTVLHPQGPSEATTVAGSSTTRPPLPALLSPSLETPPGVPLVSTSQPTESTSRPVLSFPPLLPSTSQNLLSSPQPLLSPPLSPRAVDDQRPSPQRFRSDISNHPLPVLPRDPSDFRPPVRAITVDRHHSQRSAVDWIVPLELKNSKGRSVSERIQPTLDAALIEREKYANRAKLTGLALNVAIGLQVILGALTTGLAASTGPNSSISTAILGGLSTVVASYLARARGSGEPEVSALRAKDLEQFVRDCEAFILDHGHIMTEEHDTTIDRLRQRFERLLGNANANTNVNTNTNTNAEPKASLPV